MDGFAVRAADLAAAGPDAPVPLRVVGESRAGRPAAASLRPGEAIAISTGAMIPAGADAVVRVEDSEAGGAGEILFRAPVEAGADVRGAGEDMRAGERVLRSGTMLGPAELGVLSSAGVAAPPCIRRPRVAVLTSGDELQHPGEELRAGGVRNTNLYAVSALARQAGAELVAATMVGDDERATAEALADPLEQADAVIVCGGVSVGAHDHVRPALAALGVEERFWGVALRPGKPTWFGAAAGRLVFGLPGNPVSAMVTFILFARPALLLLGGYEPTAERTQAALTEPVARNPRRAQAVRVGLRAGEVGPLATPTGPQGSHVLTSMLGADGLAMIAAGSGEVGAGEAVPVELLPGGSPLRAGGSL
jgi:molybdopterin molybdotransferase